ncbi:GTP-binding protein Rhes [Eurosta solidaginis]|uniref:GTP-binding protein Rhes n=1 Tax=Eurosta solidaginis TaxID=178769 RepID=UPI0035305822
MGAFNVADVGTMERCRNWFCARNNNNNYAEVSISDPLKNLTNSISDTIRDHVRDITNSNYSSSAMTIAASATTPTPTSTPITITKFPSTTTASHVVTFLNDVGAASSSNGAVTTSSRVVSHTELHPPLAEGNLDIIETMEDLANGTGIGLSLCDDSVPSAKNCFRLIMLGSARVGKSSIVTRFLGNRFNEAYIPTIEDFHRKLYRIRNDVYQLDILDTSGHHPFPAMRRLAIMTGDIFILVFSMDSRESFEEVVRLRENILETKWAALNPGSGMKKKSLPKIPMVIAGNKCDREPKKVQLDEVMGYIAGQDNCCVFVECSARQNLRIDDLFYTLFMVSNLPLEMAPNHHRLVVSVFGAPSPLPPHTTAGGTKKNALSIKRRFSDACGVVVPNARRPSIRTDLNLMRSKMVAMNEGEGAGATRREFCGLM